MPALPETHQDVSPDRLLSDLSELWTSMGKEESPDGGVLRACAMTLMVFADEEDDRQDIGETIFELMRSHPSRAIVVNIREAPGTLESRVFAQCWKPQGQALQICCEQVELTVSLDRLDDLPSIVGPIVAPDLPRVVWFRSRRVSGAADLSGLIRLGDKMVVDSARPGAPGFADLRTLIAEGCIVGDLAWTRLTRLRELLAQLIGMRDPASLKTIELSYGGSGPDPSVKYLQAWLRVAFPAAHVDVRPSAAAGSGELAALRMAPDLNIELDKGCAEYEVSSRRQHANIAPGPDHRLLAEELNIMRQDPVFERALARMTPWALQTKALNK